MLLLLDAISSWQLVVSLNPAAWSIRNRLHALLHLMLLLRHLGILGLHQLALILLHIVRYLRDYCCQGNLVLTLHGKCVLLLLLRKDSIRG